MNVGADVNFEELARSTDDFNAAQVTLVKRGARGRPVPRQPGAGFLLARGLRGLRVRGRPGALRALALPLARLRIPLPTTTRRPARPARIVD
jgi:hypothetical protein